MPLEHFSMQSRCRNKKWAKQKGLKIPLFWQRRVLGSCTRFSFSSFYCVGFGLVPHTATCLTGRRSRSEALVSSQRPTAFVCAERRKKKKKKKKQMRRPLNGPEAVICCWQTGTVLAADALTLPLWADSWLSSPGTAVFVHTATCF